MASPHASSWEAVAAWSEPNRPSTGRFNCRKRICAVAPRECTGQPATAAPQHRPGHVPRHLDDAIKVEVALGIEDLNAALRQRVGAAALRLDAILSQLVQQIVADAMPVAVHRACILLAHRRCGVPDSRRQARPRRTPSGRCSDRRRARPPRRRGAGCRPSCRRSCRRAAAAPAGRRSRRSPPSNVPLCRCRSRGSRSPTPRAHPSQMTSNGPHRPTNSAAVSSAPVRSSAIRRMLVIVMPLPRQRSCRDSSGLADRAIA